jgi:hypothetical protein
MENSSISDILLWKLVGLGYLTLVDYCEEESLCHERMRGVRGMANYGIFLRADEIDM